MGSPSEEDVDDYAEFLVQVFPEAAVEILVDDEICDQKKIRKKIDRLCHKLGNKRVVDGLILNGEIEKLQEMKAKKRGRGESSTSSTPDVSRRAGVDLLAGPIPISPLSMGSETHAVRHKAFPPPRTITVWFNRTSYPLIYNQSGTDDFFIDDTKLDRFGHLLPDEEIRPRLVPLGGDMISVSKYVNLTWCHEHDSGTRVDRFWVVGSGTIKHADVLIASPPADQPWGQQASSGFPPGFDSRARPPAAPSAPPAFHEYGPSVGLHSESTISPVGSRTARHSSHGMPPNLPRQHPPQNASHGSRTVPSHASTAGSIESPTTSHRTARASASGKSNAADGGAKDMVTVTICLQSAQETERDINLNAAAEVVLKRIKSSLRRVPGFETLDWSQLQLTIIPLVSDQVGTRDLSLDADDFEECWESTVKFMRRNRAPKLEVEFSFDIV